jgi:hypothetical protein
MNSGYSFLLKNLLAELVVKYNKIHWGKNIIKLLGKIKINTDTNKNIEHMNKK